MWNRLINVGKWVGLLDDDGKSKLNSKVLGLSSVALISSIALYSVRKPLLRLLPCNEDDN